MSNELVVKLILQAYMAGMLYWALLLGIAFALYYGIKLALS